MFYRENGQFKTSYRADQQIFPIAQDRWVILAYIAYNTYVRIDGMPVIIALLSGGFFATLVGMFFGIPSLRVKGLYLAVATLAAQFFCDWAFLRISWFTNNSSSGSVAVSELNLFGFAIDSPVAKYLFCLGFLMVFG